MSQRGILFSKKKHTYSQSEVEDEDDVWDDRKINDAYDRGMELASAELAKRLAMNTNTKFVQKEPNSRIKKTSKSKKTSKPQKMWKAGMSCRALYYKDGLEYEAIIQRIVNDDECVVKYLGYNNSESVALSSLKQSHGVQAQARQIEEAVQDYGEECHSSNDLDHFVLMNENREHFGGMDCSKSRGSKKSNFNLFDLPEVPPMPNMSMLKNLGSAEIPMPPPPPIALKPSDSDDEQQVISSMLLSWYMNGYYTGLYQGMRNAKKNQKN